MTIDIGIPLTITKPEVVPSQRRVNNELKLLKILELEEMSGIQKISIGFGVGQLPTVTIVQYIDDEMVTKVFDFLSTIKEEV